MLIPAAWHGSLQESTDFQAPRHDGDAVAAGRVEEAPCVRGMENISVPDNGNPDGLLDRADIFRMDPGRVQLSAGPRMDAERRGTGLLQTFRHFYHVDAFPVPAESQLGCNGDFSRIRRTLPV